MAFLQCFVHIKRQIYSCPMAAAQVTRLQGKMYILTPGKNIVISGITTSKSSSPHSSKLSCGLDGVPPVLDGV